MLIAFLGLVLSAHETQALTIYVKVLVDEEERTIPAAWQKKLKDRIDAASQIINQYCDIHFAVGEYATWQSDNRLSDFNRSLREFEQEVMPGRGQIAIGFSSQFKFRKGRNGLGGTRGPLSSHILLRESAPNVRERERLEALVHELGHFLGAAHSKDRNSAMRPVIGDGRARASSFRIGYDPINARIVQLVGTEVKTLGVRRFQGLSDITKNRIRDEYETLARELPSDPAAKQFIRYIDRTRAANARRRAVSARPGR